MPKDTAKMDKDSNNTAKIDKTSDNHQKVDGKLQKRQNDDGHRITQTKSKRISPTTERYGVGEFEVNDDDFFEKISQGIDQTADGDE